MHIRATATWLALALASVALPVTSMAQTAEPPLPETEADVATGRPWSVLDANEAPADAGRARAPRGPLSVLAVPDAVEPAAEARPSADSMGSPADVAAQDAVEPTGPPSEAAAEAPEAARKAPEQVAEATEPSEVPPQIVADPSIAADEAATSADAVFETMVPTSEAALQMANWVIATRDHEGMPFMVIDKVAAEVLVFDAHGKLLGMTPALFGITPGDDSAPGVGDRELSDIKPEDRTTPAGRFVAKFGYARGDEKVLWVDYETSISLHPVVTGNQRERRLARLESPSPEDNRITFGCINVPAFFYTMIVDPLFEASTGIVYILPELKPMGDVFPAFRGEEPAQPEALARAETEEASPSPAVAHADEVSPPQDVARPDEVPPPGDADRPDELSPAEVVARAEALSRPSGADREEPRAPVDEPRTKRPHGPMEDEASVLIAW